MMILVHMMQFEGLFVEIVVTSCIVSTLNKLADHSWVVSKATQFIKIVLGMI